MAVAQKTNHKRKRKSAKSAAAVKRTATSKKVAAASKPSKRQKVVVPVQLPPQRRPLPSAFQVTKQASTLVWQHRKLFAGIAAVYGILNLILVQGIASSSQVSASKKGLLALAHGHISGLTSSSSGVLALFSSSSSTANSGASVYQTVLVIVVSLAIIWALRQTLAGNAVRIRDAYYHGPYPLVPFILVIAMIGLQLIPFIAGASLYGLVVSNGIAVHVAEQLVFLAIFLGLSAWSLYMVSASLLAVYIVTLPDMTPLKALRSAKELAQGRRLLVLRKILFLPLIVIVVGAIIMALTISLLTPLAAWVYFLLTLIVLVALHSYMYTLYRGLL